VPVPARGLGPTGTMTPRPARAPERRVLAVRAQRRTVLIRLLVPAEWERPALAPEERTQRRRRAGRAKKRRRQRRRRRAFYVCPAARGRGRGERGKK